MAKCTVGRDSAILRSSQHASLLRHFTLPGNKKINDSYPGPFGNFALKCGLLGNSPHVSINGIRAARPHVAKVPQAQVTRVFDRSICEIADRSEEQAVADCKHS